MTNKKQRLNKVIALCSLLVFSSSEKAFAGFNNISDSIGESVYSLPTVISAMAYLAGAAFVVFGAIRVKSYVESPGNMPLKNALGMLFIGSALLAMPITVETVRSALDGGSDSDFSQVFTNLKSGIRGGN